jgi:hypothetical protein
MSKKYQKTKQIKQVDSDVGHVEKYKFVKEM